MDDYFYSKIALSMLVAGMVGFAAACWWCWNLFSGWRARSEERHHLVCAGMEEQINQSAADLAEARAKLQETIALSEGIEAKFKASEARLRAVEDELKAAAAKAEMQLAAGEAKWAESEAKWAESEAKWKAQLAEKDAALEDMGKRMLAGAAQNASAEETWKSEAAALRKQLAAEAEAGAARIQALEHQIEDHRQTLRAWEAHLAGATREHEAKLAAALEEAASLRAQLADRSDAMSRLEADAALLSHVRQSMRERQTRIDGLHLQLQQARRQIADLQSQLSARNEMIGKLEADAALLSHLRQSMRQRQLQIDGLKVQLAKAEAASRTSLLPDPRIEDLTQAIADKDRQIQLLEGNLLQSPASGAPAASSSPSLEEELMRVQAAAAAGEIAKLRGEIESIKSQAAEREATLTEALAERDRQIQLLEGNLLAPESPSVEASLRAELDAAKASASASRQELLRTRAELADRDERLAAWEIRYEAAIGELHADIGKLTQKLRELEGAATTASGERTRQDIQARLRLATLRGIQFLPDSADLLPDSMPVLSDAVLALRCWDGAPVEIAGHTDSWGDPSHNLDLSRRRAEAVRQYLIANGISPDLLTAVGYGGDRPIADNGTPDGRFANRRIEFVVR